MSGLLRSLATTRLDLRPLVAADAAALREAIAWDREEAALTGWTPERLPELLEPDATDESAALLRGPTLVGALLVRARARTLELDGLVMPAWRGLGYAVEVLAAIVDRALADPRHYDAVQLDVSGGNTAAIRAARALGFSHETSAGARRSDGFRGDRVVLRGGPELVGRAPRCDARHVERLIATLGHFEARTLCDRNAARAGRELPPLRRHPLARDELPAIMAGAAADFEAARQACGPFGTIDMATLARAAAGLSAAQLAELQKLARTSHSSASEFAAAMAADALLLRIRRAGGR